MNEEATEPVSVKLKMIPFGEEVSIRQVALGMQSVVLIEPDFDEDENIVFNLTASGLDLEELRPIFDLLNHVIQEGEES